MTIHALHETERPYGTSLRPYGTSLRAAVGTYGRNVPTTPLLPPKGVAVKVGTFLVPTLCFSGDGSTLLETVGTFGGPNR